MLAELKTAFRRHFNRQSDSFMSGKPYVRFPSQYRVVDLYFEAAWIDSWCHRRCFHRHSTLLEAAECAMPQGPAWYVFAVENGRPRQLTEGEEQITVEFRFARH
jgi:hypothetical protein